MAHITAIQPMVADKPGDLVIVTVQHADGKDDGNEHVSAVLLTPAMLENAAGAVPWTSRTPNAAAISWTSRTPNAIRDLDAAITDFASFGKRVFLDGTIWRFIPWEKTPIVEYCKAEQVASMFNSVFADVHLGLLGGKSVHQLVNENADVRLDGRTVKPASREKYPSAVAHFLATVLLANTKERLSSDSFQEPLLQLLLETDIFHASVDAQAHLKKAGKYLAKQMYDYAYNILHYRLCAYLRRAFDDDDGTVRSDFELSVMALYQLSTCINEYNVVISLFEYIESAPSMEAAVLRQPRISLAFIASVIRQTYGEYPNFKFDSISQALNGCLQLYSAWHSVGYCHNVGATQTWSAKDQDLARLAASTLSAHAASAKNINDMLASCEKYVPRSDHHSLALSVQSDMATMDTFQDNLLSLLQLHQLGLGLQLQQIVNGQAGQLSAADASTLLGLWQNFLSAHNLVSPAA